jgi:glutamine amidotransferase PdxT
MKLLQSDVFKQENLGEQLSQRENFGSICVAVAAGLLSDNHRTSQAGKNPFEVLNHSLNTPALGPQAQQFLLKVEVKRK